MTCPLELHVFVGGGGGGRVEQVMQPLSPENDSVVRRTIRVASGAGMRAGWVADQGVRWSAKASGLWAGELQCQERLTRCKAKFDAILRGPLGNARYATKPYCRRESSSAASPLLASRPVESLPKASHPEATRPEELV